ncbi:hypothetical protein Ae201684P_010950 [Aphanomyces euteiches]|uniref:Uncharacterized protein n=1 Tax=Aphanomyces euteiches TaxID=100861 RepID=A0A6G0XYL9_9STRA|nr:hypothetical protein Ae201684_000171 [Aphanomyces euteiches]KAH9091403.1 hypothetical protein Ae201684P_010950 [Aphanomyces euteiches]
MPLLLRRSAPSSTVEELAEGYSFRSHTSRRISAPDLPRSNTGTFNRTASRSEPAEFIPARTKSTQEVVVVDRAASRAASVPSKPVCITSLVNRQSVVNSLAFELNRLPKTYVRLCWERVVNTLRSSFVSSKSSTTKKPAKTASDPPQSPSSMRPSSTTSAASNASIPQFSPQA